MMIKLEKKNIKNCIIIVIFAWIIGMLGLLLVYSIPSEMVKKESAVEIFQNEGPGPVICEGYLSTRLDNYTDSIMINTASYTGKESLLKKALLNYHYEIEGETPFEAFVLKETSELDTESVSYARYWHGYLIVLKPLLCFIEYSNLRIINILVQIILMGWIALKLFFSGLKQYILPVLGMFIVITPIVIGKSMQYSSIFYIMALAILVLLYKSSFLSAKGYIIYFMLVVGCVTSYFDFLTYPIATLCVSLVFLGLLDEKNKVTLKDTIMSILVMSVSWGFGYVGMWAGKWVLASLFTGENIIKDAILSGLYRISSGTSDSGTYEKINSLLSLKNNLAVLESPFYLIVGILFLILVVVCSKYFYLQNKIENLMRKKILYFLLIGFIPFIWIMLMCNHSYVHSWMTYRNLSVSVLAWGCALVELLNFCRTRRNIRNDRSSLYDNNSLL